MCNIHFVILFTKEPFIITTYSNKSDLLHIFSSSEIKVDKIAFQKFIESFFYASDGKAAQRIIAEVESYLLKKDNN